jgi:hypothetical protein
VRFGLTAIKGLGEGAIQSILAARGELGGRIPSLHALCEKLDMRLANKRVFEALVKSGACDSLVRVEGGPKGPPLQGPRPNPGVEAGLQARQPLAKIRAQLFAAIDGACEHGSRMQRNNDVGQVDLFGGGDEAESGAIKVPLPDVPPWSEIDQLNYEKESLGLYWSGHPVDRYADALRRYGAKTTGDLIVKREPADGDHDADASETGESQTAVNGSATSAPPVPGTAPARVAEDISIGVSSPGFAAQDAQGRPHVRVHARRRAREASRWWSSRSASSSTGTSSTTGAWCWLPGVSKRDDESRAVWRRKIQPLEIVRERLRRRWRFAWRRPRTIGDRSKSSGTCSRSHKGDRPWRSTIELNGSRSFASRSM